MPKKTLKIFFKNFFRRLALPLSNGSFTRKLSIVNLGQITLEANAPTSGWNFLMILAFMKSLHATFIRKFQFGAIC